MGGILSLLGGTVVKEIANSLIGKLAESFQAYLTKQITIEELRGKMVAALLQTFAEVEKAQAAALSQTFQSFMGAVATSQLMQKVWATVVLVQLGVLTFAQIGIPLIGRVYGGVWPSSGATIDWAYALIVLLCGGGPLLLQRKPSDYKTMIQK